MRIMQTTLFQIAIWSGIYWGAYQGVVPVANLLGVGLTLISLVSVPLFTLAHVFFSEEIQTTLRASSKGTVLSWLFRASSVAQALVLIMIGDGWIILGAVWLITVILAYLLTVRSQSVDTQAV